MGNDMTAPATKKDLLTLKIGMREEMPTKKDLLALETSLRKEIATVPATKVDIKMLMDEIGKLYDANERWKNEIMDGMDARFAKNEKIFLREMKAFFENRVQELQASWNDQFGGHETRIVVLEQKTLHL